MKHYEFTGYPDIYSHTYWGAFSSPPNENPEPEIITARNNLAANIHKWCKSRAPFELMNIRGDGSFDHPEAYILNCGGVLLVTSLYHNTLPPWAGFFFKEHEPLYLKSATSFVAKFDTMRDVRDAVNFVKLGISLNAWKEQEASL